MKEQTKIVVETRNLKQKLAESLPTTPRVNPKKRTIIQETLKRMTLTIQKLEGKKRLIDCTETLTKNATTVIEETAITVVGLMRMNYLLTGPTQTEKVIFA